MNSVKTTKDSVKEMFSSLKEQFGYSSPMQAPRVEKVIVSTGIGKVQGDKKRVAMIKEKLAKITGQKPKENAAKISVAGFKLREGNIIGYQVTLRGDMMNQFLDKLINIALPRTRDFRGLDAGAIDQMGNYSMGIKENTIFPETSDEDISDVFSLGITVVTTAKTKDEAEALLRGIGMPLRKSDDQSK